MKNSIFVYSDTHAITRKTVPIMHLGHVPYNNHHYIITSSNKSMLQYLRHQDRFYISIISEDDLMKYCVTNKYKVMNVKRAYCDIDSKRTLFEFDEYDP